MPRLHLTDMAVRRLKPTGKQVIYWDTASSVALRVSQAGGKSFMVVVGEERRKIGLGRYPDEVSLADARSRAEALTREREHRAPAASIGFPEALSRYLAWAEQHQRASTLYEKRRLLKRHFEGRFARKQVSEITVHDIGKALDQLAGAPSEARHAYIAIRAFFSWCSARQYVTQSPCEKLPAPARSRSRERVLDDAELAAVYEVAGEFGPFGSIVRLCIVTGQRRGEIGSLKWTYFDPEQTAISFPGSVVKNGRPHALPLTAFARSLLPLPSSSPYLFPARGEENRPYNGWSKTSQKLKDAVGFDDWCLHDLRRSAASGMARIGREPHVIERILNHAPRGMTAVYQRHHYFEEMRSALEAWSRHIERLVRAQEIALTDAILDPLQNLRLDPANPAGT